MKPKQSIKGFTLIEVLVATLIMAIGLLGLASLQSLSLKQNNHAYYRSIAVMLAEQMANNIRANPSALSTYSDTAVIDDLNFSCINQLCSPNQMAAYDVKAWAKSIINALPVGEGAIERNGEFIEILVSWNESNVNRVVSSSDGSIQDSLKKSHKLLVKLEELLNP
ncbi:MAG: type IV pilus modification protein PilV [Pseudomonadota bacterium]